MDNFQPSTGSIFNPHQMSGLADTAQARAQRRSVFRSILAGMGVLMVIPGVRLMVRHESRPRMIWGAAIVVVGLVPVTWCAWRVFHHVRQLQRIHMNLCAHCAYPTKGVRKGRCPECGKDPFEPG